MFRAKKQKSVTFGAFVSNSAMIRIQIKKGIKEAVTEWNRR